jgi:hypothetical protein
MVRGIKSKGACLIVNTILSQLRGTLDYSFDSDLYKKYGQKDETNSPIPLGELDPAYLAELVGNLGLVSECEGWESITTFRFNGHRLSLQHIGLVLQALKALPRFRPTTFEIKGTSPDVVGQLKGLLGASLYASPPILLTNARPRGVVGGIARNNSSNSNTNRSPRRLPGVRAPNTRAANAYRAASNVLTRAAATGNMSGVSETLATALGPSENLNLATPVRNPFKGKTEAGVGVDAAPVKKGWFSWAGRRKTRHKGAKKLKSTCRKNRR